LALTRFTFAGLKNLASKLVILDSLSGYALDSEVWKFSEEPQQYDSWRGGADFSEFVAGAISWINDCANLTKNRFCSV
jgi:hypothetical protein